MREDLVCNWHWMSPMADGYLVRGRPIPLTRMADILIWIDAQQHQVGSA